MSFRIEVQPDLKIEIMRSDVDGVHFDYFDDPETAITIIKSMLRRDIVFAKQESFESRITKAIQREIDNFERKRNHYVNQKEKAR